MMFMFTTATEGQNKLRLREAFREYAHGFGVPAHAHEENADRN